MRKSSPKGNRSIGKGPTLEKKVAALTQELSAVLEQQAATSEILRVISRSRHDDQPVFNAIAESAARLCKAEFVAVYRFDGTLIHFAAHHGLSPQALEEMSRVYPLKPGKATTVARSILNAAVAEIPDTSIDPHYAAGLLASVATARSVAAIPMLENGEPIGSIAVARPKPGHFPPRDIKLLETFAHQAVIAVENARLFGELNDSLNQQTATADVLKIISRSAFDLQVVLDTLVESAARLCHADMAGIARDLGEEYRFVSTFGFSPEHRAFVDKTPLVMGRGSGVGRAVAERRTVHLPDVTADPEYTMLEAQKSGGFRSLLAVPLLGGDTLIGVLVLQRKAVQPFTQKQIELVTTFADQAVIAIENVRLFEEAQQRNRELIATSEVLRVISRSPTDIQPVFEAVAESAARLCEAYDSIIFLKKNEELVVGAHYGPIPLDWVSRKIGRHWVTGRAVVDRVALHIRDLTVDADEFPESSADAFRQGHRTMLAVPLLREEEAVGALVIRRTEVRPFSAKQIELLNTFADQAVIAIQNVHLFDELQQRNRELSEALEQQTATSAVLRVIAASPTDIQPVLKVVAESAARLCEAHDSLILLRRRHTFRTSPLRSYVGHQARVATRSRFGERARHHRPLARSCS
jgi:two-component system NtrC family sensor kinase